MIVLKLVIFNILGANPERNKQKREKRDEGEGCNKKGKVQKYANKRKTRSALNVRLHITYADQLMGIPREDETEK